MQFKNNPLFKILFSPNFPPVHYSDNVGFLKKWFFNPLKRYVSKIYLILLRIFSDIKVIGITGSAGKTTTKEMLAGILRLDGKTVSSKENIDPIYNIPNTILHTPPGTKYLILEMGVEYPDEMEFYLWLAKPDVGVITNIFPTHLEFFGSEDGVLKEKSKLVLSLKSTDTAVLNKDDYKLKILGKSLKCKVSWFSSDTDPTRQNSNAAAKASESLGVGREVIKRGLTKYNPPAHRLKWLTLKNGSLVLDDSYNSNPKAVLSALNVFLKRSGKRKKIAVLGDMLELGKYEIDAHKEVGRKIAEKGLDVLIGVGKASNYMTSEAGRITKNIQTFNRSDINGVMTILKPMLNKDSALFIKGSHSIGLYKLADKLY